MKIIDINTSLGDRNSSGQIVGPTELIENMDHYHIDHSVAFHKHACLEPPYGNRIMCEIAAHSAGRIGFCAVLDPALGAENLDGTGNLTQRLRAAKPEAIRIFPDDNRTVFAPIYWEEILDAANACAQCLILDFAYTEGFFRDFPEFSKNYPNIKFVMINYGLCRSRHFLPLLQHCSNLYITMDTMMDHMQIEECYEKGVTNRLLFASNYPQIQPAGALGLALYADIPEVIRQGILSENWEAIHP